ncbi:MAG: histidinol-phosphatase [Clostridia bacterium]|nr:histidinol-phosphatase [Clostridia bacterium]
MKKFNYHTHTTYCDGKNTPLEIVQKALKLGISELGFSGHASMPPLRGGDTSYCMTVENTVKYREEIFRLKKEFSGKIKIFCGIEKDYYSSDCSDGYDFIIGSVHFIEHNGRFFDVDLDKKTIIEAIEHHWHGSADDYATDYFGLVKSVYEKTKCSIIGHFDLLTKFNENHDIFDEKSDKYLSAAEDAVKALSKNNILFEINTGAISRGYRTAPYPSPEIMKMIKAAGGKVTFSSDCHQACDLLYGFDSALGYAKSFGFDGFWGLELHTL